MRAIIVALFMLPAASAMADCRVHSDGLGDSIVRCDDGRRGSLTTEPDGYTGGRIGDEPVRLWRNPDGSLSGSVGDTPVRVYREPENPFAPRRYRDSYQTPQPGFSSGFEAGANAARGWR